MPEKTETVTVTLKKSLIGASPKQKAAAEALGLRKISQSRPFRDGPAFRGQLKILRHLVSVAGKKQPRQ